MIARHDVPVDRQDVWARLAATLPGGSISWRQDGKPVLRNGQHYARFVAYVDANTVRERLDSVCPGEWDLTLELLPAIPNEDSDTPAPAFKARLQVLGVIREDVGMGRDYKSAATDAFKRAAVRFGIAHELYDYEQNWVQVDGDSRYAKPLEDPQAAYVRRHGTPPGQAAAERPQPRQEQGQLTAPVAEAKGAKATRKRTVATTPESVEVVTDDREVAVAGTTAPVTGEAGPHCPKCGGKMWDNRVTKRNPKAPDFKCRDRSCDGVVWPPRDGGQKPTDGASGTDSLALIPDSVPF